MAARITSCVVVLLLAVVSVAHADDSDPWEEPTNPQALAHLQQGRTLFDLGKWEDAIKEFEAGALLDDRPIWMYNLGQSHRMAQRYDRAKWYFERFITRIEGMSGSEEDVATVRRIIADMTAAASRPPTSTDAQRASGSTEPAAEPQSRPATGSISGSPSRSAPRWYEDWVGWALAGTAVAASATATGYYLRAEALRDDGDASKEHGPQHRLYERADDQVAVGTALLVGGGVVAAAAIVRFVLVDNGGSDVREKTARYTVDLGPGSAYVTLRF